MVRIRLVELGLGSTIVPSWYAPAPGARCATVAMPIAQLPPSRVGWAVRESHELLTPARAFMRSRRADLHARATREGVRLLG